MALAALHTKGFSLVTNSLRSAAPSIAAAATDLVHELGGQLGTISFANRKPPIEERVMQDDGDVPENVRAQIWKWVRSRYKNSGELYRDLNFKQTWSCEFSGGAKYAYEYKRKYFPLQSWRKGNEITEAEFFRRLSDAERAAMPCYVSTGDAYK